MSEVTKVIYDTEDAIKAVKKLDDAVVEHGDKAEESFELAGSGVADFGKKLAGMNPKIGAAVNTITKLAGSGGLVAGGFIAGAAAIGGVIANLTNLAGKLADVNIELKGIRRTAEGVQDFLDLSSSVLDAQENFAFIAEKEELAFENSALIKRQIANDASKRIAAEDLAIQKKHVADITKLAKDATKVRENAEKRLADKRKELAISGPAVPGAAVGVEVDTLTSRAKTAASRGDIDAAEELINKAKELTEENGNGFQSLAAIESAQNQVVKALERGVEVARQQETARDNQLSEAQAFQSALSDRLEAEKKVSNEIRDRIKLLSDERRLLREAARSARRTQEAEQSAREVDTQETSLRGQLKGLGASRSSFSERFRAGLQGIASTGQLQEGAATLAASEEAILREVNKVFADRDVTPREAADVSTLGAKLQKQVLDLKTKLETGEASPALNRRLEQVEELIKAFSGLGEAGVRAGGAGVGIDQGIRSQAQTLRARTDTAAGINDSAAAQQAPANINVTATIKGGMIDSDTAKEFTEIVRTELRKQTLVG